MESLHRSTTGVVDYRKFLKLSGQIPDSSEQGGRSSGAGMGSGSLGGSYAMCKGRHSCELEFHDDLNSRRNQGSVTFAWVTDVEGRRAGKVHLEGKKHGDCRG